MHDVLRGGCDLAAIEDRILASRDIESLATWLALRDAWDAAGALTYEARDDQVVLASLQPTAALRTTSLATDETSVVLSRFAAVRAHDGTLVADAPLAAGPVVLHHPHAAAILATLAAPRTAPDVAMRTGLSRDVVDGVLNLLCMAGIAAATDAGGHHPDDTGAAAYWAPHDADFLAHTRPWRRDRPVGATGYLQDTLPDPPAVKPPMGGHVITLDAAVEGSDDLTLQQALEHRRSLRAHAARAITLRELGLFLHRTARAPRGAHSRLHPGGGARHPLEVYVVANRCEGLDAGLYHYRATDHALEHVAVSADALATVAHARGVVIDGGVLPQLHLVITARMPRMAHRYQGIALALVQQEVGALLQTMYLVATAMRLAPCAVGTSDAAAFARVIGVHLLEEPAVGGLVLGASP